MKRFILLCLFISTLFFCGTEPPKVDTIIEDGVEVVLNHLEPYEVKDEPILVLKKQFTIDTEKDENAQIGLNEIWTFDVDSDGNIYLLHRQGAENCLFVFDSKGEFVSSFGRKGQGPGELQSPMSLQVLNNEIAVSDITKIVFFNMQGDLIKETKKKSFQIRHNYTGKWQFFSP